MLLFKGVFSRVRKCLSEEHGGKISLRRRKTRVCCPLCHVINQEADQFCHFNLCQREGQAEAHSKFCFWLRRIANPTHSLHSENFRLNPSPPRVSSPAIRRLFSWMEVLPLSSVGGNTLPWLLIPSKILDLSLHSQLFNTRNVVQILRGKQLPPTWEPIINPLRMSKDTIYFTAAHWGRQNTTLLVNRLAPPQVTQLPEMFHLSDLHGWLN